MCAIAREANDCPDCGGRGWIVESDGGAGSARPCGCRHRRLAPRLLDLAGIPSRYARCRFDDFEIEVPDPAQRGQLLRARTLSEQYVESFVAEDGRFRETGLLYVGPPGVGKTHLASAVLRELVERYRVRGLFVDFTSLLHQIQATFDPSARESKHTVLGPVERAEVLVLDELGAQKPSDWVTDILYLIMNARYAARLPTIFTTNYDLEPAASPSGYREVRAPRRPPLADRISASLVSRLFEMAQPVVIEADDYRREIAAHQHRV